MASHRQRNNLPAQLTSFLGREQELAMLGKLVGEARLVTLTGPAAPGRPGWRWSSPRARWSGSAMGCGWPIWPASPTLGWWPRW